uniref:Uncharacterized protein n=1 Tax=Trypanosoma vivax (strain Y486) TaxID=1055687 RepID=G0U5K3_TRYVY|nr:conserved hypothetical protein [Trypanosoma vivax Y486]
MRTQTNSQCIAFLVFIFIARHTNAWNIGETIPISYKLRLENPVSKSDVPQDAAGISSARGNVDEQKFISRPLSPNNWPRFGINTRTLQPATRFFQYAKNMTRTTEKSATTVAVRFHLERGLGKSTAWYPVMRKDSRDGKKTQILYLSGVHFTYGYQPGTFNKITSFKAQPIYDTHPTTDLELMHNWRHNQIYNLQQGITICALISVIASIGLLHVVFLQKNKISQGFISKTITIRNHKD